MAIVAIGSYSPITLLGSRLRPMVSRGRPLGGWKTGRRGASRGSSFFSPRSSGSAPCASARSRCLRFLGLLDGPNCPGVILINLVLGHALGVYEETRGPGSLRHAVALRELCEVGELPTFFTDVWSVLLARRDGLPIAAALHADLCAVVRDDAVRAVARAALARRLAAGNVRTANLVISGAAAVASGGMRGSAPAGSTLGGEPHLVGAGSRRGWRSEGWGPPSSYSWIASGEQGIAIGGSL